MATELGIWCNHVGRAAPERHKHRCNKGEPHPIHLPRRELSSERADQEAERGALRGCCGDDRSEVASVCTARRGHLLERASGANIDS